MSPRATVRDPLRYKTQLCREFAATGTCPLGPRCQFAHGVHEMRTYMQNAETFKNTRFERRQQRRASIDSFIALWLRDAPKAPAAEAPPQEFEHDDDIMQLLAEMPKCCEELLGYESE